MNCRGRFRITEDDDDDVRLEKRRQRARLERERNRRGTQTGKLTRSLYLTDKGRAYILRKEMLGVFGSTPMPSGVPHHLATRRTP